MSGNPSGPPQGALGNEVFYREAFQEGEFPGWGQRKWIQGQGHLGDKVGERRGPYYSAGKATVETRTHGSSSH